MLENKQPPYTIEIQKVKNTIENIKAKNLTNLNYLVKAASIVIAE